MLKITEVKYVSDYSIWISFSDKKEGTIDLKKRIWGKAFAPLKEKTVFQQVKVDEILGTITWPNGADLAPETLYKELTS